MEFRLVDFIMIVAVFLGPVLAVWVAGIIEFRKAAKNRQVDIFRVLMKTRRSRLDLDHVQALNIVEIEFYNIKTVRVAYKEYIESLADSSDFTSDGKTQSRNNKFVGLLQKIAEHLHYRFDKLDLDQNSYVPIGWSEVNDRQQRNSALLGEILEGRRSFPISHTNFNNNLYPPPPSQKQ